MLDHHPRLTFGLTVGARGEPLRRADSKDHGYHAAMKGRATLSHHMLVISQQCHHFAAVMGLRFSVGKPPTFRFAVYFVVLPVLGACWRVGERCYSRAVYLSGRPCLLCSLCLDWRNTILSYRHCRVCTTQQSRPMFISAKGPWRRILEGEAFRYYFIISVSLFALVLIQYLGH